MLRTPFAESIPGYGLRSGSGLDRAKLIEFMHRTYRELYPDRELGHLAQTVEQYFSNQTPLWWVECLKNDPDREEILPASPPAYLYPQSAAQNLKSVVGCLWLGNAIDQTTGERHAHIFLLYVAPEHRRLGIGASLVIHAENWARTRGDRQIGLQVFLSNQPALNLYQKLGYQSHSIWMLKSLES
jgi:ribosomal protein S18 acetylase RimI-like enzyme